MVENEYARAVYELALEEKKTKEFKEYFNALVETLTDDYLSVISSPFIIKEEKKKMIDKIYHSFDKTFIHFLYVLIDHNRFNKIERIKKEYDKLMLEYENVLQIKIVSAEELSNEQLGKYKKQFEEKYIGKTIEIVNKVKKELIGGIQVIIDDEAIDASVKNALGMLKESI